MLQFYLLSVVLNALAGYTLFFGNSSADSGGVMDFKCGFSIKNETFRLWIGILSAFTGVFKLLSAVQGDLRIIGDIVPAASGFLCGLILILEHYGSRPDSEESAAGKPNGFLTANKKLIGAAAMIAAILHFLFPTVLLV